MGVFTVVGWSTLILCSLMCQTLTQTHYGQYTMFGTPTVNSKHIEVKSDGTKQPDGKCRYSVVGRGVKDNFAQDCAINFMEYIQINIDNYYAFFYADRRPFTLYTDTWGTLVIVKGTGCTLRTYQTSFPKEVTLSRDICNKINKKIDDEMAKTTDYWRKWHINHELKMNKQPPAEIIFDPLKDQPPTPSLYAGQPGVPVSIPSSTSNAGQSSGVTFGENGSMNFGSPSGNDESDEAETPAQPLTPSLPAQPISSPTAMSQNGGPTILGETSLESNGDTSINKPMVNVVTNKFNNDDGCEFQKIVKGNGVYDIFKMPCPEKSLSSLTNNGLIIMGHPNVHPFSVFSDEPATLYLFEKGMCSKKTYTTVGRRVNSKVEFLAPIDCPGLKGRIRDSLRKSGLYFNKAGSLNFGVAPPGDDAGELGTIIQPTQTTGPTMPYYPTNTVVTTQPLTSSLPTQPIAIPTPVTQNGGRTILGESSMMSNDVSSLNRDKFNVYGDVETNRDGTMKKCIEGRRVHDCFTIPRSYKKPGSIAMSGYVIIGHPNTHPFSVFSDEPATLYLFENGMCTKKTYTTQGGVTTSRAQLLSDTECVAAKDNMQKSLKRNNIVITSDGSISASMSSGYAASEEDAVAPSVPTAEELGPTDNYESDEAEEVDNSIKVSTNFPPKRKGQCQVEIVVEGKGVEDTFPESCSDIAADYFTSEDVFIFGLPGKTPLSLYSNEAETLYVIKNGICTKKAYETVDGVTTNKRNSVKIGKCNEIKRTIANTLKTQKSSLQQPISLKPVTTTSVNRPSVVTPSVNNAISTLGTSTQPINTNIGEVYEDENGNIYTGNTPVSPKPQFNGIQYNQFQGTNNQNSPSLTSPKPVVADVSPTLAGTSSTALGVSWREANFNDVYNSQFNVEIKNVGGGQRSIKIVGRGVNDIISEKISVIGENIKKSESSYTLALADPSKQSGIYTQEWGGLVFVRTGECYKKTYNTQYGQQTKIQTSRLTGPECEAVKDSISSALGVSFGQQMGSSLSSSPILRKGNYQSVYNARPTITITKNNNGPQDCKMVINIIGRALNDEIVGDCSVFGTNIQKKATSYSLAVADASSNSGLYTEDWGSLVVITGGQCTTRTYDSSPITHTTKVTTSPNPMTQAQCDQVKEKISGLLGANFGY